MNHFLCILVIAFVSTALATANPAKTDPPTLAGGYSPAAIDAEVGRVADFAVKAQAAATRKPLRLVGIVKAACQVVAGLNYRLELEVADGSKRLKAHAVVWKKPGGSLSLTSWD